MHTISPPAPAGFAAKTLLKRLVKFLQPELIFCRSRHLLLVLSNHPALSLKDYQEKIKACRLPGNYTHAFLLYCELERQCRLGNLFTITFCIPANCIYNKNEKVITPFWQHLHATRETAILNFKGNINKANAFFQGACFYWAAYNYPMAAFMLHQACELCLRAVNMAFTGQQVKTHCIPELIRHVKKYIPELSAFFNNTSEKEKHLLDLLEKAYIHVRYTHTYSISSTEILQLLQQVQQLHQTTERLMKQTIQSYPGLVFPDSADLCTNHDLCLTRPVFTLNKAV